MASGSGDTGKSLLIRAANRPDSPTALGVEDRGRRLDDDIAAQPPAANDVPDATTEILSGEPLSATRSQLAIDRGQPSVDVIVGGDLRSPVMAMLIDAGFLARFWNQAAAFMRAAPKLAPGCVLVDVRKPARMGLSIQESIGESGLNWPVIGIVSEGDVQTTIVMLKTGAQTVIETPVDAPSLNQAIGEAARRLAEIDDSEEVRHACRCLSLLTRRETEVLRGLVAGLPNKTIAYDLGISPRTVEVYRANIMHKFEARSLSDVLRYAFAVKFG